MSKTATEVAYRAQIALGRISFRFILEKILEPPGGASRDRTDDLKLAKLALSQLSYGPDQAAKCWNGGPSRS